MARYIMLYKGEATDMSEMTPEAIQEEMGLWAAWMESLGAAMLDPGAPFGQGGSIVDDGSAGTPVPLSGYSIIEADSLDDARAKAQGHPYIREGAGNYAIDLFELMPVPGM